MNNEHNTIHQLLECLIQSSSIFSDIKLILKNNKEVISLDNGFNCGEKKYYPFGLQPEPKSSVVLSFYVNAEVISGKVFTWDLTLSFYEKKSWLIEHSVSVIDSDGYGPTIIRDYGHSQVDSLDDVIIKLNTVASNLLTFARSYNYT